MDGKYQLQTTRHREVWQEIPHSARVFVDGGALIIYDEEDNVIVAMGAGEWVSVMDNDIFNIMYPSHESEI